MTKKERLDEQSAIISVLSDLRQAGFSDEAIAIGMGQFLGGAHPSSISIRRWRTGRQHPNRTYNTALTHLHNKLISKENP